MNQALDRITARPHAPAGTGPVCACGHRAHRGRRPVPSFRTKAARPSTQPADQAEIIAKFEDNTAELAADRRTAVIGAVAELAAKPDLTRLLDPLRLTA